MSSQLANADSRRTTPGVILGTAAYMSPEQAKGKEADRSADVWAFGCVLYEMLTGRRAFEGDTVSEILANVLKTEPDWQQLPAETPDGIRRLLRRSLQKDQRAAASRHPRRASGTRGCPQRHTRQGPCGGCGRRDDGNGWLGRRPGAGRADRWCVGRAGSPSSPDRPGDAPRDQHASDQGRDARDFARWAEGCLRGPIRRPVSVVAAVARFADGAAIGGDRGGIIAVLVAEQPFHRVLRGRHAQAHESR